MATVNAAHTTSTADHADHAHALAPSDLSYLLEVLNINDGETEDQLDERLRREAKELGVEVQTENASSAVAKGKSQSVTTYSSSERPRRSESLNSRASHSTDLTSLYSEHSHGRKSSRRERTSLSFRDYDAFLARGMPLGTDAWSFSPLSTPAGSTFSLPLAQPSSTTTTTSGLMPRRRHLRRIRGLGRLTRNRNESVAELNESCPHCPPEAPSPRRDMHKLACGHCLCTQAIRNTVNTALDGEKGAVPSCCRIPIPGQLVEQVMTHDEQDALLEKLSQWDEALTLTTLPAYPTRSLPPSLPPIPLLPPLSAPPPPPHTHSSRPAPPIRSFSSQSRADSLAPEPHADDEQYLERADYQRLLHTQAGQRDRFVAWSRRHRTALCAAHEQARADLRATHEAALEDLAERHASAMAEAEDKQVRAEGELREAQAKEHSDVAVALRHMEAYCAGVYDSSQAPHGREVQAHDRAELDKARRRRDALPLQHASAINVLRGEQGRRIRLRALRQEKEAQETRRVQRREELELERACTAEVHLLDEHAAEKKKRVKWRWELEMAVFAAKVAKEEGGATVDRRWPTAEWTSNLQRMVEAQAFSTGFMVRGF